MSGIYKHCFRCGRKTWHRPLPDAETREKCEVCHPEVSGL